MIDMAASPLIKMVSYAVVINTENDAMSEEKCMNLMLDCVAKCGQKLVRIVHKNDVSVIHYHPIITIEGRRAGHKKGRL